MSSELKSKLNNQCIAITQQRLLDIESALELSQEALVSDTKSSAGDKYETSREVIQQDISRFNTQLTLAKEDLHLLQNIDHPPKTLIGIGSLVLTNQGDYYIAVGLGKVQVCDKTYFAISPSSPLAKIFLGKKKGDEAIFNQKIFKIGDIH